MTLTRWTLRDVGGALPWDALSHFLRFLPASSATVRAMRPDESMWLDGSMVAPLLADCVDAINSLRYEHALAHTPKDKHKPQRPPLVRRPGTGDGGAMTAKHATALRSLLYEGEEGGD